MASLKVLMVLLPLAYSVSLYLVTNQITTLAGIALLSILVAGVITGILSSLNIVGSGMNSTGTLIVFTLIFGGAFYGVSVAGLFGSLGDPNSLASVFYDAMTALGITPQRSTGSPDMSNANLYGSVAGISYPYKAIIDIIFGIIYALGLYLLVSDRGGD